MKTRGEGIQGKNRISPCYGIVFRKPFPKFGTLER
jgi:hypothetical protein